MTYEEWDAKRRQLFPNATHDHWDSWEKNNHPAGWNPHTGKCFIVDLQPKSGLWPHTGIA